MLPWWGWLLFWVVLVVGSLAWLALLARGVWAKARALGAEVERAGALVAELEDRAREAGEVEPPSLAVIQPPNRVREEHRDLRAQQAADRRARRAQRLPPWARVD